MLGIDRGRDERVDDVVYLSLKRAPSVARVAWAITMPLARPRVSVTAAALANPSPLTSFRCSGLAVSLPIRSAASERARFSRGEATADAVFHVWTMKARSVDPGHMPGTTLWTGGASTRASVLGGHQFHRGSPEKAFDQGERRF